MLIIFYSLSFGFVNKKPENDFNSVFLNDSLLFYDRITCVNDKLGGKSTDSGFAQCVYMAQSKWCSFLLFEVFFSSVLVWVNAGKMLALVNSTPLRVM